MGRIVALDIGAKRTGIAITDPLKMFATGLTGLDTAELIPFLTDYVKKEAVECWVVGKPMQMNYTESESWDMIMKVCDKIKKALPAVPVEFYDERFTSKIALQSMKMAGAGKKQMHDKHTVDMVSATVILQNYLESKLI